MSTTTYSFIPENAPQDTPEADILNLNQDDDMLGIALGGPEFWLILYRYGSGECDTISASRPDIRKLQAALFDERESGNIRSNYTAARLPGGRLILF